MNPDWLNPDSLHCPPGIQQSAEPHIETCEEHWRDCDVCLSWIEELLENVAEGRIHVPESDGTTQTELPL